ncbi:Dor1-like family-domain-containing protein [Chytriomyces cf. hyalinus JEL632]|nr:Dor1-like family-domain-containing protein [Chytriomyces cf. hyalinus JEL632]
MQQHLNSLLMEMGLSQLRQLPVQLAEEQREIDHSLAALASKEHRAFLQANACARNVETAAANAELMLDSVQSGCDNLSNALVALSEAAADSDIVSATNSLQNSTSNAVMSTLRLNYDSLMDIISIPTLFDAFVRAGAYEDALDLASFVSRLVLRYPSVTTVQSISAQVSASTSLMLAQLVAILRSNAKLPLCIRVIGYLRRMEVYPETELRLVFLQQKDAYFCQVLAEIRESDPADHLKKYIEVSRENFFDIITQYKAIFADAAPTGSSTSNHLSVTSPTSSYTQAASSTSTTTAIFYPSTRAIATQSILSSYVAQTVSIFLETLKSTLPKLTDTQSINSLLTQTMYYGMSLGRVGCDFRVAATDMYLDAILHVFCSTVDQGLSGYFKWIESNPVANPALGLYVKVVSSAYTNSSTPPRSSVTSSQQGVVNPPSQLNAYPPLAHVLNVFYSAFNGLRVSAPLALRERVRREVEDRLRNVVDSLVKSGGVLEKWADSAAGADGSNGVAQSLKAGANTAGTANASTRYLEFCEACRIVSEVMVPAIIEGLEVRLFGISAQVPSSQGMAGAPSTESYSAAAADIVRRVTSPLVAPLNKFCAVARKSAATAAAKDAVAAASKDAAAMNAAAKLEMAKLEVDKNDAIEAAKQNSVEIAKEDTVGIAVRDPATVEGTSVAIARESTPTEQPADLKQTQSTDNVSDQIQADKRRDE